jgi:cytosine/adenosine deaminase-related metal-dependent hydrolase
MPLWLRRASSHSEAAALMLGRVAENSGEAVRREGCYDAATIGGADALQRPDLGRLQPGAKANIVVIDLGHDRIGQVIDPVQTLMIDASRGDVRTLLLCGKPPF